MIETHDLSREYGPKLALSGLNLRVEPGEILGFLGPNGAGKSTTVKILTGMIRPTRGTARVAGFDVRTQAEQIRTHIGYMSQKVSLYANLTVRENLLFFGGLYGLTPERVATRQALLFPRLGLSGLDHTLIREMSVGLKQRVALVSALLHDPEIVFLDEPTAGVDVLNRQVFWDLIRELAAEGKSLFVTTHYLDEMEYAHHVGFIDKGKLIGFDSPLGLKIAFAGGYPVRLRHDDPSVLMRAETHVRSAGYPVTVANEGEGRTIRVRLTDVSTAGLDRFRHELHAIAPALDFTGDLPSIEEVFAGMIRRRQAQEEGVQ